MEYKKDQEIEALREDLKVAYPERAASIDKQTDYGVLTFLESCAGRGPTCMFTDAITSVALILVLASSSSPTGGPL